MLDKDAKAPTGGSLIDGVADWLMTQALSEVTLEDLLDGCCARLAAAGLPLERGHIAFRTLHPLFHSTGLTWRRGQGVASESFPRSAPVMPDRFRQSPLFHMIESQIPFLRRRLTGDEALLDFPVLEEFRDQGITDYLGFMVGFSDDPHDGIVGSWATTRASGFSERDVQILLRIQRRLGVAFKVHTREQIARNVLHTYLGPKTGRRVLDGQIERGDGETIHAVIWYSDLRNSTRLAAKLAPDAFFHLLNSYFECTAGAVLDAGGEVLLLIGDAVLAIFPLGPGVREATACRKALAAAREAEARLARINQAPDAGPPLKCGVGLHIGNVMYGNIGVPERLEFTVVGHAVNEVARLEGLTKRLGSGILVSADFARHLRLDWQALGAHKFEGVDDPQEVYAPPSR
jgi:adenylate cyclase